MTGSGAATRGTQDVVESVTASHINPNARMPIILLRPGGLTLLRSAADIIFLTIVFVLLGWDTRIAAVCSILLYNFLNIISHKRRTLVLKEFTTPGFADLPDWLAAFFSNVYSRTSLMAAEALNTPGIS